MRHIRALRALFLFKATRCTIQYLTEAQRPKRRVTREPVSRTPIAHIIEVGVVGVGKRNNCLHRARASHKWLLNELVVDVVGHNKRCLHSGKTLPEELAHKRLELAQRRVWIDVDLPPLAAEQPQSNVDLPIKKHPGLRRHIRCQERLRAEVIVHSLVHDQGNGRRRVRLAKEVAHWLLHTSNGRLPANLDSVRFTYDRSAAKLTFPVP